MNLNRASKIFAGMVAATILLSASRVVNAQSGAGQSAPPAATSTVRLAEQQFKNIQVLKGVPADQVIPTMQFISNALGVECEFCHVPRQFDKDDKKPKQTARAMMQMQMAIDKDNFKSRTEVTCNTCHRGSPNPQGIPAIPEEGAQMAMTAEGRPGAEAAKPAEGTAPGDVTVEQIWTRYQQALGGEDAIRKLTSVVEKGNISFGQRHLPVEVFAKAPEKRATVVHTPNGENFTVFDGKSGWTGDARGVREMNAGDTMAARLDAQLHLATGIYQLFSQFRVARPEKIDGHDTIQLIAFNQGQPPVRLFFDAQSGLLVREVRYVDTPLGRNPSEINYADYRDVGGTKLPYKWTIARPNGRFTIQIDQVQVNVPVDDSKFEKPAPAVAPAASGGAQRSPSR